MEIGNKIKAYRNAMNMSQERLADRIFVSRQTVSNWENDRSYPDIHSLLLLGEIFGVSLDKLVKGDIGKMKQEIDSADMRRFNRDSVILTRLWVLILTVAVPLALFRGVWGLIAFAVIGGLGLFYAFKVEKRKKRYDIQTYKEITAFVEGRVLPEDIRQQEIGKRNYQKILLALVSALIGAMTALGWTALLKFLDVI